METTPPTSSSTQQTSNIRYRAPKSQNRRQQKKPDELEPRDNPNNANHNAGSNAGSKPQRPPSQHTRRQRTRPHIDGDIKNPTSTLPSQSRKDKPAEKDIQSSYSPTGKADAESSSNNRDGKKGKTQKVAEGESMTATPSVASPPRPAHSRPGKAKFNAGLTPDALNRDPGTLRSQRRRKNIPHADAGDLTSNLIRELSTRPFLDCLICFSPIHPQQPSWSCSPLIPLLEDDPSHQSQYCWTTFHLKCIREWAEKNYNEVLAAWKAREQFDKDGEWRCPGCQGRRNEIMEGYVCFCGSTRSPNNRLATPHSCGNNCSRPRTSCSHSCPLLCHPGPCPPCKIIMDIQCECIRKQTVSVRCGEHTQVSCGKTCSKILGCGKHSCQQTCHLGPCTPCERKDILDCWCGKEQKQVLCGEGDVWLESVGCDDSALEHMQEPRKGFGCQTVCGKPFDCGDHACMKSCHPPSSDSQLGHCPMSPDRIFTCPCGKQPIATSSHSRVGEFPARTHCTDPIPTCASTCLKPHSDCEHLCQAKCHISVVCPPCFVKVVRPCRCGSTIRTLQCGDSRTLDKESGLFLEREILCDRPCMAMRACGKHQCNRICCPLASLAKGKMKAVVSHPDADPIGFHQCDLVCGKMLNCGNHQCEERDHRGPCRPCLRSSFEEIICFCGQTVLEPPIPCGTKIHCSYPCSLPPPPCGHSKTPHTCHFPDSSCPPCVHLTDKPCACGKKTLSNIRCSLDSEKVSCGIVCGKPLSCGGHKCDSLCHAGECGVCTSMCGKARKMCLPDIHPCTNLCHAPTGCDEDEPCQTRVELTCECGRIRQAAVCGTSRSNPAGLVKRQTIKCTAECALKQRNARLADALGIKTGGTATLAEVTYSDELVAFARANLKFLTLVENILAEFVKSNRTKQVLPHMTPEKRNFAYKLAGMYRLDSQTVDQDPHRSVQIIRRIDTRIPTPLLSDYIRKKFSQSSSSNTTLGKLVNLRGLATPPSPSGKPSVSVARSGSPAPTRGWTSVVAPAHNVAPRSTTPNAASRTGTLTPPKPTVTTGQLQHNTQSDNSGTFAHEDVPDNWEDDI